MCICNKSGHEEELVMKLLTLCLNQLRINYLAFTLNHSRVTRTFLLLLIVTCNGNWCSHQHGPPTLGPLSPPSFFGPGTPPPCPCNLLPHQLGISIMKLYFTKPPTIHPESSSSSDRAESIHSLCFNKSSTIYSNVDLRRQLCKLHNTFDEMCCKYVWVCTRKRWTRLVVVGT